MRQLIEASISDILAKTLAKHNIGNSPNSIAKKYHHMDDDTYDDLHDSDSKPDVTHTTSANGVNHKAKTYNYDKTKIHVHTAKFPNGKYASVRTDYNTWGSLGHVAHSLPNATKGYTKPSSNDAYSEHVVIAPSVSKIKALNPHLTDDEAREFAILIKK